MSFGRIKIRRSDKLFREYLLKLRGCKCDRTGIFFPEGKGLDVSHFYGRRHEATRHDPENCDLFTRYIHQRFGENPAEYTEFKKKQLGEKRFKALEIRANQFCKRDDKMREIELKAMIKSLD